MTRRARLLGAVLLLALAVTAPVLFDIAQDWYTRNFTASGDAGPVTEFPPQPRTSDSEIIITDSPTETGASRLPPARGNPAENELYVVIDTHNNRIYLRTYDSIIFEALCSTGTGAELTDEATGRRWNFATPRGAFRIDSRVANPWWRKPDWAFIEDDKPIPTDERERYDPNMLGDYAIGFGDGYFIHGTLYERLLGVPVTHGCIRVGADNLQVVYDHVRIGTYLYII